MKLWSREDDLVIGRLVGRLMSRLLLNDNFVVMDYGRLCRWVLLLVVSGRVVGHWPSELALLVLGDL